MAYRGAAAVSAARHPSAEKFVMTQIVLNSEQVGILAAAQEPVAICRPDGSIAGWISPGTRFVIPDVCPFTPEELAAAEKEPDSPGTCFSTKEVLEHLQSLDRSQP
jgi:hypothetical protein